MSATPLIEEVSKLVSEITGVQLGRRQAAMVESRLSRRMIQLGFNSQDQYLKYIQENQETEIAALVSLLTTHHTNFFREFSHFEFLANQGLPKLIEIKRKRGEKTLTIWSAACSRGHEVYSLSMFLSHHLKKLAPEMSFKILGTDVDAESIALCKNGVYRWEEIKSIPSQYLAQHWIRGTGDISDFVKAKDTIKAFCEFSIANLLDFSKEMAGKTFDIIFCRNVFIYFTSEQIKQTTLALLKHLVPHGLLFVGISESLNGIELPIGYLAPSVYGHKGASKEAKPAVAVAQPTATSRPMPSMPAVAPSAPAQQLLAGVLRVLCVDDSGTILTLLKKILTPDHGFEIVGTAMNGAEAAEKRKTLRFDIMTLDIHMPVQTGIEYLERNFDKNHPPVVMITSVSRENAQLGVRSLELGAMDYIEKPSLSDLSKRADEIRMKLRYAATFGRSDSINGALDLSKSFQRTPVILDPDKKAKLVIAGMGDRTKLTKVLKAGTGTQPPTIIFIQGGDAFLDPLARSIGIELGKPVKALSNPNEPLASDFVYVADLEGNFNAFHAIHGKIQASIMIFGDVTSEAPWTLANWPNAEFLVEDLGSTAQELHRKLLGKARRLVPYTSFAYHAMEYLSQTVGS